MITLQAAGTTSCSDRFDGRPTCSPGGDSDNGTVTRYRGSVSFWFVDTGTSQWQVSGDLTDREAAIVLGSLRPASVQQVLAATEPIR